ncbi:hypothetical protein EI94DRAFT_1691246 [Lactarius quietus]|nr:hypothetical protein EI94DRAFT_1691246 [Lactarius quietus]
MTSVLNLFRDILFKSRSSRGFFHRFFRHWALFFAFLGQIGRRLNVWRLWGDRKRGAFPKAKQAECSSPGSFPGTNSSLDSRKYAIVAASTIPESASHPSLREANQQPQAALSITPLIDKDLAKSSSVFDTTINDTTIDSIRSHDKPSIKPSIIQTGQPTQFPGDACQFGSGPSVPPSREHPSRSPSPPDHLPEFLRLYTDVTNPHRTTNVDDRNSPINPPSAAVSNVHESLNPRTLHRNRRRQSSTSVVVRIDSEALPTGSHPLSPLANQQPLTDEPYAIGSPIEQPSPVADVPDAREGSPQHNPIASSPSVRSNLDLPDGCIFQMINSEQIPRYTKAVTVPRERTSYQIPPLTTTFLYMSEQIGLEQGSLTGKEGCSPWLPATHPDGALYFFDRDRRLFTDTDMYDPLLREEMEDFYGYLQRIVRYEGVEIPSKDYDLVLDVVLSEERLQWSYYYACHEKRCLFWLDPYDATHMISELCGVKSPAHVKHRLEGLYWNHWTLFPAFFEGRRLDRAVVDELMAVLSFGCIDRMTNPSSTQPYDNDTMQQMLSLMRNVNFAKDTESKTGLVYHTVGVARLLSFFAHWRFLFFHGQHNARLVRHRTVYVDAKQSRTLLFTLLSAVLFLAPHGYLREFRNVWVDEVVIQTLWVNFIYSLLEEWDKLVLVSTVMLSANVGFLAVPGVVISNLNSNITSTNQVVIFTSSAQISSCMSMLASIGSIVTALLLIRHLGSKLIKKDPEGASTYLYENSRQIFGLELLAIILSLPWALLMWSLVTFFCGLLFFCFSISNPSTRVFVAVTSVVVFVPVVLCIRSTTDARFSGLLASILRTLYNVWVTCLRIFAVIGSRLRRESPSSATPNRAGGGRSSPDHEAVGVDV